MSFKKTMDARLAAKKKLIPKTGFNLVAVDSFERDPEDELYLVGHFKDQPSAEKAKKEFEKQNPHDKAFIYGPDTH